MSGQDNHASGQCDEVPISFRFVGALYRELQGRVQSPVMKPVAIHRLERIRVFLQPVARQKQIGIATDCDPACFAVADYELLHRMLLNLVLMLFARLPRRGASAFGASRRMRPINRGRRYGARDSG